MTKDTTTFDLDPESFGGEDFPSWQEQPIPRTVFASPKDVSAPLLSPEEEEILQRFYEENPHVSNSRPLGGPWIQTYTGRRFDPINPVEGAIVIEDIGHSLSMQCRFSGHVKKFYSVAQHSVLVSYICDSADALWGLMHDASEAYLVDIPSPLKRSGKFETYKELESQMMSVICKRFGLTQTEPPSVKKADRILLSTEARDLMSPLHPDWVQPTDPLPFKIDPLPQQEAKDLFMKRFFELTSSVSGYDHYLRTSNRN